jgi:DNA polymerase-1
MATTLVADIEANGLMPEVDTIFQVTIAEEIDGTWVYSSYHGDTVLAGLYRIASADRVVGHNFIGYDVPVIAHCAGVTIKPDCVVDTLVLSRLGNPERPGGHALADWGERIGIPKPVHDDWTQWSPEMEVRCEQDVRINVEVWERLRPMLEAMPTAVDIEHKTAWAIAKMCCTGIHFDEASGRKLLGELMEEAEGLRDTIQAKLPFVYKPKHGMQDNGWARTKCLKKAPNKIHWARGMLDAGVRYTEVIHRQLQVGSRNDMIEYLKREYDWVPTEKTKTGQPKLNDEVLRGLPWEGTDELADYFKLWKIIGYMNSEPKVKPDGRTTGGGWLHHVTPEGKLHAGFIPLTAVTGRPSCVAPNLQQVPTDKRVRSLFGPRRGWKFVGVDADGQELRCLGHYLARYDGGEYGRAVVHGKQSEGTDIHSRVQELIGFHTRNGTKPVEYGLLYGAGNPKLGMIALKDAMSVGKDLGKKSLKKRGQEIRSAIMDGLTGFKDLGDDVRAAAGARGKLKGLDLRTLWVRSPHSALNLLLQSAGIIHMKMAISMMEDRLAEVGLVAGEHYNLVLWVHDELQFEVMPEHAELLGKTAAKVIEDAAVKLDFRVPMTGTYDIGNNWSETH